MAWRERFRPLDFSELKRLVPLQRLLDHLGWRPVRRCGRTMKGNCPLHSRSGRVSTSFAVRGNVWYCHSCKTGGDVVELWAELGEISPVHAALSLCGLFGVTVPRRQ